MTNETTKPRGQNRQDKYGKIQICSNTFENVEMIFEFRNMSPLIIEKGDTPKITLYAVAQKPEENSILVVDRNETLFPRFRVWADRDNKKVSGYLDGKLIFEANQEDEDSVVVSQLDLRLLGLNIWGDTSELNVGSNKLSNNTVIGARVAIGLG